MKTSLFIFGSQRSGTTMLSTSLGRGPDVLSFGEGAPEAMTEMRLRPLTTIRDVIDRAGERVVAFKPLCDSQWAARILQELDSSRVIWAFRQWRDQVRSTVRKWPGHPRETLQRFAAGDLDWLQWRAEGMTAERLREIGSHWHEDATDEECAAILWYFRNELFFDQVLDRWPALVRPLDYRDVVTQPERVLRSLADFAGFEFDDRMIEGIEVRGGSGGVAPIPDPIVEMCDRQYERLRAAGTRQD